MVFQMYDFLFQMCVVNKGAEICGMEEWICVNGVSNVCESSGMGVSNVL